jgi:hypothetical protein
MEADGSQPQEVIRRYVERNGGRVEAEVVHLKQSFGVEELTEDSAAVIAAALADVGVRSDRPLDEVGADGRVVLETRLRAGSAGAGQRHQAGLRQAFAAWWRGEQTREAPLPAAAAIGDVDEKRAWPEPPAPEPPAPEPPAPESPLGGELTFGGSGPRDYSEVADRVSALVMEEIQAVLEEAEAHAREVRETAERDAERILGDAVAAATSILGRIDALAPPLEDLVTTFRKELVAVRSGLRDRGIGVDLPPGNVAEEPAAAEQPAPEQPAPEQPAPEQPAALGEPSPSPPEEPPPRGLFGGVRRESAEGRPGAR